MQPPRPAQRAREHQHSCQLGWHAVGSASPGGSHLATNHRVSAEESRATCAQPGSWEQRQRGERQRRGDNKRRDACGLAFRDIHATGSSRCIYARTQARLGCRRRTRSLQARTCASEDRKGRESERNGFSFKCFSDHPKCMHVVECRSCALLPGRSHAGPQESSSSRDARTGLALAGAASGSSGSQDSQERRRELPAVWQDG